MDNGIRPRTQGPEPSALHLAPWVFSTGVIVSLGEGFVCDTDSK